MRRAGSPAPYMIADLAIRTRQLSESMNLLQWYHSEIAKSKLGGISGSPHVVDISQVISLVSSISAENGKNLEAMRVTVAVAKENRAREAKVAAEAAKQKQLPQQHQHHPPPRAAPPPQQVQKTQQQARPQAAQKSPTAQIAASIHALTGHVTPTKSPSSSSSSDESFEGPRTPTLSDFNISSSTLEFYSKLKGNNANAREASSTASGAFEAPQHPSTPSRSWAAVAASPVKQSTPPPAQHIPIKSSKALSFAPAVKETQAPTKLSVPSSAPRADAAPSVAPTNSLLITPKVQKIEIVPSTQKVVATDRVVSSVAPTAVVKPALLTPSITKPIATIAPTIAVLEPTTPQAKQVAQTGSALRPAPSLLTVSQLQQPRSNSVSQTRVVQATPLAATQLKTPSTLSKAAASAALAEAKPSATSDASLMPKVTEEEKISGKAFLWAALDLAELNSCVDRINEFLLRSNPIVDFVSEKEFYSNSQLDGS